MFWLAQRGTKVVLVEARTVRQAGELAAKRLKLGRCRPRRWRIRDWDAVGVELVWKVVSPEDANTLRPPTWGHWPTDWRGTSLRPASLAEVAAYQAVEDQVRALRGLSRKKMREAFA